MDGRGSEVRLVVPYIHRAKKQEGDSHADRAMRRRVSCPSMTCFHYLRRTSGVFHAWFHVVRQTYAHLDKGSKQYGVS